MQKFNTLDDAIRLAKFIHHKQVDKMGEPYFGHVYRVYQNVVAQGASIDVQIAAILHDSTEDSKFTCDMLLTLGVPEAAVEIVRLVDRDASALKYYEANVGYGDHPSEDGFKSRVDGFYYAQIKKNPSALQVKLADIGDNLQPWRLAYLPEDTQERLRRKYDNAITLLTRGA